MSNIIVDMQKSINEIKESFIKLQVINDINLKLSEEMKSIIDKLAGDRK